MSTLEQAKKLFDHSSPPPPLCSSVFTHYVKENTVFSVCIAPNGNHVIVDIHDLHFNEDA
ncbi:hypothetical protein A0J61_04136 [Choanephora cucurbitarum]|uniref:Uncharacterized protein n=1 Tax=Choanephora cucurbitarum TaxID=101091 RepID=A0A1C7NFE2_9FUNG|nr:hypothetical protein A0J61_04136 [Choanephora cucurbitarum]